jgi:endonuclease/exonuclease/phosphatase family metal-dependent hydrolase
VSTVQVLLRVGPSEQRVELVNTHLDAFDHSEQTRLLQISHILERVSDSRRCLILGDFNSVRPRDYRPNDAGRLVLPNSQAVPEVLWGFLDAHPSNWDDRVLDSFSVWTGRRVDFCLSPAASELQTTHRFVRTALSDHLPLAVRVKIPAIPAAAQGRGVNQKKKKSD